METDIREVNFSKWQNYNKISLDWFFKCATLHWNNSAH